MIRNKWSSIRAMSIQSRREKERNSRIEAIKKSAWKIFLRDGLHNSKISEIAKDCSLGLATLYYYFKDKRQIVYSLMLEYKNDDFAILYTLITSGVTVRVFLDGYINSYIDHFQRFRFFVLADSYYNYHRQYDLSDEIINRYDEETRSHGEFILNCLAHGLSPDQRNKTRVGIAMIIGFLRRYALIPEKSWPRTEEDRTGMIEDFKEMILGIFRNIGYDLDSHIVIPENSNP